MNNLTFKGASILLVDDNRMNLKVAAGILKPYGADVYTAESGEMALEMVECQLFDLILLDHLMPEMDGLETFAKMEKMKGFDTPVVVLTANVDEGAEAEYIERGFSGYLRKPMKKEELEEFLIKYLSRFCGFEEEEAVEEEAESLHELQKEYKWIDLSEGLEFALGKKDFYKESMELFMEESNRSVGEMATALLNRDTDTYRIVVHSLKSTAHTIGASQLSEFAQQLEDKARDKNLEFIEANLAAFIHLLADTREEVEKYLKI